MKTILDADLRGLSTKAAAASRLRTHLNVHAALEEPVQRLFIAFEPGTYVRPHRHPESNKWEMVVLIRGAIDLLLLDDEGRVADRVSLSAGNARAAEIPSNTWHSYVCRQPGTILLEVKEGPYVATTPENFAAWSPPENDPAAAAYLERLGAVVVGDKV